MVANQYVKASIHAILHPHLLEVMELSNCFSSLVVALCPVELCYVVLLRCVLYGVIYCGVFFSVIFYCCVALCCCPVLS